MKTGLESLDTGAPEITYSGNEGPKSPQQMQQMQQMQMAQLEEEYDAYVDDMLEQGIEPMSMQQFLEQIAAEAQMSSNEEGIGSMMEDPREMAADGGIMRTGVKHPDGRTGFFSAGLAAGDDISPGTSTSGGSQGGGYGKGGPPGGGDSGMTYTAPPKSYDPSIPNPDGTPNRFELAAQNAKEKARLATIEEQKKIAKIKKEQEEKEKEEQAAQDKFSSQKAFKKFQQIRYNLARSLPGAKKSSFNNLNDYKDYLESQGADLATINRLMEGVTKDKAIGFDEFQELAYGYEPEGITNIETLRNMFTDPTRGPFDKITAKPQNYSDFMLTQKNNPTLFAAGDVGNFMTMPKPKGLVNPKTGELYTNTEWNALKQDIGQDRGLLGGGRDDTPKTMTAPSGPGDPSDPADPAIPTDPVTGQYSNEYFIPGASNFYSNLPSTMFNPTTNMLTLANGGRANFAGGGIANLRQGYFLGKLVKSITKPFKKAFRGFKKIAKSPLGKMALMYFGGNLLQGNFAGSNPFTGGFKNPFKGNITNSISNFLSPNAVGAKDVVKGGNKVFPKLMDTKSNVVKQAVDPSGNFLTRALSSAFKPENAFTTIAGISGLSGLYTNYINNKREDESMADYQRRLEIERGNFAPIPVDPVQFAANGGRMGFADGGDDDDEDFRQKALGALYSMKRPQFSMGGGAGMPPVTMMSEGQDTQSFGDDESTGMPQATPTMQNQMPMRPPMMDPRMQQQMMAQRGNPMMNRGMMSMQQPRIMAQEGGMMDMGGMEKDYRNEGGFVPIGGQERADDVPARLSKNEFVFTADAVRNAGGGDIDRGAEIMENMMENLEQGGKVSKASQGLSGAREMFATQQRLGEVL
jgi:hypothetical protein